MSIKGPFCCWVENRKETEYNELGDDCKSQLLFKVQSRMILMEAVRKGCFGIYLGVKTSYFAAALDAWCEEEEGARTTEFFA